MIGQKFGKLTVVAEGQTKVRKRSERPNGKGRITHFWVVECDCKTGLPFEISEKALEYGVQQCKGCSNSGANNAIFKHGENIGPRGASTESPEYRCWKAIKTRCYNRNYKQYEDYGGRGIRVCRRWLVSFENFLTDMGRKPSPEHSIQREDNDGDYAPDNCLWATDAEQRRNRRTNVWVVIGGRKQCVTDWLREFGTPEPTYRYRRKKGWSPEEALLGRRSKS